MITLLRDSVQISCVTMAEPARRDKLIASSTVQNGMVVALASPLDRVMFVLLIVILYHCGNVFVMIAGLIRRMASRDHLMHP